MFLGHCAPFLSLTLQVPSIHFFEGRGLCLRYYFPSHAEEHWIPAAELRVRDPLTGSPKPGALLGQFQGVFPVSFDYKGNYGVAIVWR